MDTKISGALEDYIVTIRRLEEVFGQARTTHIARELKVRPATVTKVVGRLQREGYVVSVKYRNVKLTARGKSIAEYIIRKHRILEVYLAEVLDFNIYESHRLAHHLEHMPDVLVNRMYEKLGKPRVCPHGNPIPGAPKDGEDKSISLREAVEGKSYALVRVAGELNSAMEVLGSFKLKIGDHFEVVEKSGDDVTLRLKDGKIVRLDSLVAAAMRVREA